MNRTLRIPAPHDADTQTVPTVSPFIPLSALMLYIKSEFSANRPSDNNIVYYSKYGFKNIINYLHIRFLYVTLCMNMWLNRRSRRLCTYVFGSLRPKSLVNESPLIQK